jgi:hypothetical protein
MVRGKPASAYVRSCRIESAEFVFVLPGWNPPGGYAPGGGGYAPGGGPIPRPPGAPGADRKESNRQAEERIEHQNHSPRDSSFDVALHVRVYLPPNGGGGYAPGGGPPLPGPYCMGAAAAATGIIAAPAAPPTPRTGPDNPSGAAPKGAIPTPRPAGAAAPGPPDF